jgi:hypothetical protein
MTNNNANNYSGQEEFRRYIPGINFFVPARPSDKTHRRVSENLFGNGFIGDIADYLSQTRTPSQAQPKDQTPQPNTRLPSDHARSQLGFTKLRIEGLGR